MTPQERQGWTIVAGLGTATFLIWGTTISTIGIFANPMTSAFNLTAQQVSSLATVFVLGVQFAGLLVGWLLNRVGALLVMSTGAVLVALGYFWIGISTSLTDLVLASALSGIGVGASTLMPAMVVAANWIQSRQGLALGVILGSSALGATICPPLIAHFIAILGWRLTADCIAVLTVLIALPITLSVVRTPPRTIPADRKDESSELRGPETGPEFQTPAYWLLILVMVLGNFSGMGVYFSTVSFLERHSYSLEMASFIFGATSLASLIGYLTIGAAADRRGPRPVLLSALIVGALGIFALLGAGQTVFGITSVIVFVSCWGLTSGTVSQLAPLLILKHFGLRRLAPVLGTTNLIAGIISSFGSIVTGWLVDATGGYTTAFELSAFLSIAGVVPLLLLKGTKRVRGMQPFSDRGIE